jgi:hypothetical protein
MQHDFSLRITYGQAFQGEPVVPYQVGKYSRCAEGDSSLPKTIDTKCKLLDELVQLEQQQVPMAQSVLRLRHSNMISAKNISLWSKDRELLFAARDEGFGKFQSLVLVSRVRFKEQEDILYLLFLHRRRDGDEIDDNWLSD